MTIRERLYYSLKSITFRTPVLRAAARLLRARVVEARYARTVRKYSARPPGVDFMRLLEARSGERLEALRALRRRPRILFVGTDYDQDTSGLLAGLETVGDVVRFTRYDGAYGQTDSGSPLSFGDAARNGRRLLEILDAATGEGRACDLVVGQMWAGYIDVDALAQARDRHRVVTVNIAMDDRHVFRARKQGKVIGTHGLIRAIDLAATAAPEAVGWYLSEGCPALFFPEASDPGLFAPLASRQKRRDVAFVGARYGIRERLVRRLVGAGIHVEVRGAGWPGGRLPVAEVPRFLAEARIVLGVGAIGHSSRLVALKMRDFDGPMSGSCYVTQDNPDLHTLYRVGDEIAVYRDDEDCLRVVSDLLLDDERRAQIALAGRRRAEAEHTWEMRFNRLWAILHGDESVAAPADGVGAT